MRARTANNVFQVFIPSNYSGERRDFLRRALVTGGAGFIGSHLSEALLERGWEVTILDDLTTGLPENVPPAATFVQGSVLDRIAVSQAVTGADTVFHLAASVSVPYSVESPIESFGINADGTLCVLEAARLAGVSRFVFSSSSAVYGDGPEFPKHEGLAPKPLSPYAAGKMAGEALVAAYSRSYGMAGVSLRYFNIFGPRQRPDSPYAAAIPIFLSRMASGLPLTVFGDGGQTRDFTFVDNVVEANLLAASADVSGEVVNVASGESITLNQLINELAGQLGVHPSIANAPPRQAEVQHSSASVELASELLGYVPLVGWRDGLGTLVRQMDRGLRATG